MDRRLAEVREPRQIEVRNAVERGANGVKGGEGVDFADVLPMPCLRTDAANGKPSDQPPGPVGPPSFPSLHFDGLSFGFDFEY